MFIECDRSTNNLKAQMFSDIAPPRQRKRAFKRRSVTGCTTCKVRRIKCDETEPSCRQCLRGRRICDGYPAKDATARQSSQDGMAPITPPLSPTLFDIDQEHRCFDFFRHRTIPRLSRSFDSPFWNQLLLQATHHEASIRHAAIAVGSLHEFFELGSSELCKYGGTFALQQYVKAIKLVMTPIRKKGKQAADVALMACILFVCFEILRGYHSAALSHIDGGVKIISELQSSQTSTDLCLSTIPYAPLPILNHIFFRLNEQSSLIARSRPRYLLYHNLSENDPGYDSNVPESFTSFESARNSLGYIRTCATRMQQSLSNAYTPGPKSGPTIPVQAAEIKLSLDLVRNFSVIRLKQWSSAFESLLQEMNVLNEAERRAVAILKLHRVLIGLNYSIDFVRAMSDEMIWDEFFEDFERMVAYAKEVTDSATRGQPSFTLDTEIILPIYIVAVKCRHSGLRRKAIALLRQEQRQEGVWNSLLTAGVAERLVEIEEEGLNKEAAEATEVSRWKRVTGVELSLDTDRKRARLTYVKLRTDWTREIIVEHLDWSDQRR